jgi:hypothetical protein
MSYYSEYCSVSSNIKVSKKGTLLKIVMTYSFVLRVQ